MRWEVIKENKKVRKHAFNQESDQKKKRRKKEEVNGKTQIRFKHLA